PRQNLTRDRNEAAAAPKATATAPVARPPSAHEIVGVPPEPAKDPNSTIQLEAAEEIHKPPGPAQETMQGQRKQTVIIRPSSSIHTGVGSLRRGAPGDPWQRSPLTVRQEVKLLDSSSDVAVVFGSRLACLEDVEKFLRAAVRNGTWPTTLENVSDRRGFV